LFPIEFRVTSKSDPDLLERMANHYSHPKGFVGRSICYAISYEGVYYGHIVGGSATRFLPGRNEMLGITLKQLNNVINNVFFNVSKVKGKYPLRWFTAKIIEGFVERCSVDWQEKYGDNVVGFESLVELPRTGELYKHAGWTLVGETKGFTCKRVSRKKDEQAADSWSGKRVWDRVNLHPKLVFCYKLT